MTNKEALQRGMAALEERKTFTVTRKKAKHIKADSANELDARAADAEAWNMLNHLSGIL